MATLFFVLRANSDRAHAWLKFRAASKPVARWLGADCLEHVELFVFGRQERGFALEHLDLARCAACASARKRDWRAVIVTEIGERSAFGSVDGFLDGTVKRLERDSRHDDLIAYHDYARRSSSACSLRGQLRNALDEGL